MADNEEPTKRPAPARRETMQPAEARQRVPYYLPDLGRSVMAVDAAEAVAIARLEETKEEAK